MEQFQFPDEISSGPVDVKAAADAKVPAFEIEVVDDTPPEDRNRKPLNKSVEEITGDDEAEQYSENVKKRMRELSHVAHDERRAKEAAIREQAAATEFAKRVWEENQRLQRYVASGENTHKEVLQQSASAELTMAKKALTSAYQSGDAEKVAEATEAMQQAVIKQEVAKRFVPSQLPPAGQQQNFPLPLQQPVPQATPAVDSRAARWQARNQWFGDDPELTSFALGYHKKLIDSGVNPQSDEYYEKVDARVREKFPEYFGEQAPANNTASQRSGRSSPVAPVGRTTGARKVTLSLSQQAVARKLGISNEQYAKQVVALENRNG